MTLDVLVDDDTLLEGLQRKADQLPEELKNLVTDVTFIVETNVKIERPAGPMPVQTGNLQGSISIDNLSDYEKRIFPDEGIAPYAEYVIRGVRGKVFVGPMDFLTDGAEKSKPEVNARLEEFKQWILE
jgi:hypothetical protein